MPLSPQAVYNQNIDKQRIVITGSGSSILTSIITKVLTANHRKFDQVINGEATTQSGSQIILIEEKEPSKLIGYQHHLAILTGSTNQPDSLQELEAFADATPKGGTLIYPEADSKLKAIGEKQRADIQSLSYKTISHEVKSGKIILVSSKNEKFPIQLSGDENLQLLASAKEVLKKIGISSQQFYTSVSTIN